MAVVFDLVSSFVLGGAILVIILSANDNSTENHYVYNGNMLVQEMLITTSQYVEGELRNMGLGVTPGQKTIIWADTSSITYLTDLHRDGVSLDTISYYLGPTSELRGTQNERDRYLHRCVNYGTTGNVGVVTVFKMRYLTQTGDVISTPVPSDQLTEIHVVEVTMEVQNPFAIARQSGAPNTSNRNALYSSSMWQHTWLASQNSKR